MIYQFEYDDIESCSECPFFYDYIYCMIDEDRKGGYTWRCDDQHFRPQDCKLTEIGGD